MTIRDYDSAIHTITLWLDRHQQNLDNQQRVSLRILKIGEEYGEAVQAWIGMCGQNPRKGFTHTQQQVIDELADTAITALVAIESFNIDAMNALVTHARKINQRNLKGS